MAPSPSSCGADRRMAMPAVALSLGKPMPRIGFGTATATLGQAEGRSGATEAILNALSAGYRHFDTAAANLQMEYVDLYLIHFPVSMRPPEDDGSNVLVKENLVEMDMKGVWKEMEECHRLGLARAIGVSNFSCKKLENLLFFAKIPPAANQVEVHPYCRQNKLRAFCKVKGIQLCAYSPLGGKGAVWANNSVMDCPVLKQIACEKGKSVAQVCIRWVFEQGDCVIVKSFNEQRMRENLDIFSWELSDDDKHRISALPESRGTYDFFVHESGPYKTADDFWDGEIVAGQSTGQTAVSSNPTN
nr:unnamed protein product [Digitaria exilis]